MATYLVGVATQACLVALKSFGACWHRLDSTWFVVANAVGRAL